MNERLKAAKIYDEVYTPRYAVEPILEFIPKDKRIMLPFDTDRSEFYKVLLEHGYDVDTGHADEGKDFFMDFYDNYDIIISNPPYSIKDQVLERLYLIGKPFMMLLPVTTLSSVKRVDMFKREGIQLIVFDKRINYTGNSGNWFASAYFCWKILPETLVFRKLEE